MNRALVDYSPETEAFEGVAVLPGGAAEEWMFDEADEMELATGLLEVADEAGLDRFVRRLIASADGARAGLGDGPAGRMLGVILKSVARRALPATAWRAADPRGAAPAADGRRRQAEEAGHYFGAELEGLSGEDQEFELARHFVRFAGDAVRHAATALPGAASPEKAVRTAALLAARHHAPGLQPMLAPFAPAGRRVPPPPQRAAGRWVRRGRHLILVDC